MRLQDAALYLTNNLAEPVTEADVLRLALDGKLTLSINIVGNLPANLGELIPVEEIKRRDVRDDSLDDEDALMSIDDAMISTTQAVRFDCKKIQLIRGVWDMSMLGRERALVEKRYHHLADNRELCDEHTYGIDGLLFRNADSFAVILYRAGNLQIIRGIPGDLYLKVSWMPANAHLVVRTAVLAEFVSSVSGKVAPSQKVGKIRSDREQNLLRVIAGLWELSELPKAHNVTADKLSALFDGWGWDKPAAGTMADTILLEAAKLPRVTVQK